MEKVKERLSVAKAMRILLAAVLAATLCVPTTYAFAEGGQSASDDGVHVLSLGAEEGAGDPAVPSTHAKTSNYALIASDGYVYPCDAKGNRIDTVWAKSYGAGSIDAITALFVDSNVTKLERNALKYKYAGYSRTYSSTFYSAYSTTLQTVTFKLASNGRNACRSIGASFFSGCKKLRSVTNLDKTYVDTMGSSAFARCSALTAISLPSTLKGTLDNTFYECTSLKTVSGMEKTKVTYLYFTFRSCKSLQSITLPKTCTKAGLPFIYCTALKSLTVNSPTVVQNLVANFEKDLLFNVAGGGAKNGAWINVPSNLVSAYKNNYYSKYSQDTYYPNVASHIRAIPASATPAVTPTKKTNWTRLWGNGPLDTMRKVVQAGWANNCRGTVVVATSGSYYDALSASGVAGLERAPILLTNGKNLSAQTKAELQRIRPTKVIIAGGTLAISTNVFNQIKAATGVTPVRLAGSNARATAAKLNVTYKGSWKTGKAILATSKSFQDALSAAPVAYSQKIPVFLVSGGSVDANTLSAMRQCGVKRVVVLGGTLAIPSSVETQLKRAGMTTARLGGRGARETSRKIADWGVALGMSPNRMGVATPTTYYDALCGAALCGKNNSVLVLANDKGYANTAFAKTHKAKITQGYVFGGTLAIGSKTMNAFVAATK